ncbi:MAG TPA: hypothetical protein VFM62_04420 [Arthrobacter sp.]|nr:hypothetical protein [Arthrobacter sp.]
MAADLIEFAASSRTHYCSLHYPGHGVNIVQARRADKESLVFDVRPKVEPEWGTVHFIVDGEPILMWNHDAERLAAALEVSGGAALWRPRNCCLAVREADESEYGLRRYALFSLAPLERAGLCRRTIAPPS